MMCTHALQFLEQQLCAKRRSVFEWSRTPGGWSKVPEMATFLSTYQDELFWADVAGFGLRDPWTGELRGKEWLTTTNDQRLAKQLNLFFLCDGPRKQTEGRNTRLTAYYPKLVVQRAVKVFIAPEEWAHILEELSKINFDYAEQDDACCEELVNYLEEAVPFLVSLPVIAGETASPQEAEKFDAWLYHFHRNIGHPTRRAMETVLRRQRVHPAVRERLALDRCPFRDELLLKEPTPPAAFGLPEAPWTTAGSDMAERKHPDREEKAKRFIAVDELTRVPVVVVWATLQTSQSRNATSEELLDLFLKRWVAYHGKPKTSRADAEGARPEMDLQDQVADHFIDIDLHLGQASWQFGITKRAKRTLKIMANPLCRDLPELSVKAFWALVVDSYPERERSHGLAGDEFFYKRAAMLDLARKSFIDAKTTERLYKAERARTRRDTCFRPGDAVVIWRSGKGLYGKSARTPGQVQDHETKGRGKTYGVVHVLATETILDEHGRTPRNVVWVVYRSDLLRWASQQLQFARARQKMLPGMDAPRQLPWTFDMVTRRLQPGTYLDILEDVPTREDLQLDGQDQPLLKRPRTRGEYKAAPREDDPVEECLSLAGTPSSFAPPS